MSRSNGCGFMSFFQGVIAEFPFQPLMAIGRACCGVDDGEEPASVVAACDQGMEPIVMDCDQLPESLRLKEDLLKVSLCKAEGRYQRGLETIGQLESEKSDLNEQVKSLTKTVRDLQETLSTLAFKSQRERQKLKDKCERRREEHKVLQSEYSQTVKRLEREKELLGVSLADMEGKHQVALEIIGQLETKVSVQTDQIMIQRETIKDMGNSLTETQRECNELQNDCDRWRKEHNVLHAQYLEMVKCLNREKDLLKVSLADMEGKHQVALEIIGQLETKVSVQTDQIMIQRKTIKDMGNSLTETHRECNELQNDCDRWRKEHNVLHAQYLEMVKCLNREKDLLKVSLADMEGKHQVALEIIGQLETKVSVQTDQIMIQRKTIKDMGNSLTETHRECNELQNDCERRQEEHSVLHAQYLEMVERMAREKDLLKVSLADMEGKHQVALEINGQLETKVSVQTDQIMIQRKTIKDMGNSLTETHRECNELQNECDQLRESLRLKEASI